MPESVSLKSLASIELVSGYVASNENVSTLNERSVVIGTESSPASSPFAYSENQLSAQISAVNVELVTTAVALPEPSTVAVGASGGTRV